MKTLSIRTLLRLGQVFGLHLLLVTLTSASWAQSGQQDQQSVGTVHHTFEFDPYRYWQQQVKVGIGGMLEGATIVTDGEVGSKGVPFTVNVRAGGTPANAPNSSPVLFSLTTAKTKDAWEETFVDMTAAGLSFSAGDIFTLEVAAGASGALIVGYKDSPTPYSEPLYVSNYSYYYWVPEALVFTTYVLVPGCGNNFIDAGEACDDGNTSSGDGCSADCLSNETCGNGVIDPQAGEACDDGNTSSGDGCSADCFSNETCGNGVIDPQAGEACDDGNTLAGDGCSADCLSDETCGNGVLDPEELCDDGNTLAGDGCSADCLSDETCGNGVLDQSSGEACDDGNQLDGDGCQSNCALPTCGDGVVDSGEACDDGNHTDGDGCNATCTSNESCGNGVVDEAAGEECDQPGSNSDSGPCGTDCRIVVADNIAEGHPEAIHAEGGCGCVIASPAKQTGRWWLLSLVAALPFVRRRRRSSNRAAA